MSSWQFYSIGFTAQILFSARLLLQWIASEKKKKVLAPSSFWKVSLFASFLLFVYGYLRSDFPIMLGQALTYFIYIRNLQLQGEWEKMSYWLQLSLYLFPVVLLVYSYNNNTYDIQNLFYNKNIPLWLLVLGSWAQVIFTLRFVYQWAYSEKVKESVLPLGFWLFSFAGSVLILIYAVLRKDPVLFVGHVLGSVIYVRNMILIKNR